MTEPDPSALPFPKVGRTNKRGHPSSCTCKPCQGARSRRNGLAAQRKVAKQLGLEARYRGELAQEENFRHDQLCVEIKSGGNLPRFFINAYQQAEQAKAVGDTRPVAVILAPTGEKELIVLRLEDFQGLIANEGPTNSFKVKELARSIRKIAGEIEAKL